MSESQEPLLTPRERDFLARHPEGEIASSPPLPVDASKLEGLGGWLGFLAISLVLLGPLITVAMTAGEIVKLKSEFPEVVGTPEWNNAVTISWAASALYSVISVFAGYRLVKHRVPRTVPIVIACMWIAGPLIGILTLAMFEAGPKAAEGIVRSLIATSIWTAYLLRSKRVRNTYGRAA